MFLTVQFEFFIYSAVHRTLTVATVPYMCVKFLIWLKRISQLKWYREEDGDKLLLHTVDSCTVTIFMPIDIRISLCNTIESNLSFECTYFLDGCHISCLYHKAFLLNLEHKSTPHQCHQSILASFSLIFICFDI